MKLAERYISRALISHMLVVLLILLALYFFTTLMAEMGKVGKGSYTSIDALLYSLMLMPRQIYELFPQVAMVGTILGIGSLASSNELTVLRAAGVSINRLAWAVMKSGLVLVLLVVVMGETLAPYLEKEAQQQRLSALAKSVSLNTSDGLWARDGQYFININSLVPGGRLSGITRYHFKGQQLLEIAHAPRGFYEDKAWVVGPVNKTRFSEQGVTTDRVKEERWSSTLTPDVVGVATVLPENLALWELFDFVDYLHENGLAAKRYETAVWIRLFSPLATAGMILLALPFVFGPLRSVSIGQRVMVGSLVGISFYLINGMSSRLGLVFDISPVLSAGAPIFLVYLLWYQLMRRVH